MEKQEKNSYRKTEFVNIIQLFLLGYYNLYVLDIVICQKDSSYPMLLVIAVCFSYWARESINKFSLYLLTRFGVILYGVIIGRSEKEKILFAFAGCVISLVSWYRRIHINHTIHIENIGLPWLILILPGYLFMKIYGQNDTTNVWLGISVLFIWLYYLNKYQANREKYLVNNKKTVGVMQNREIKSNSNKGMFFFLGCSFITLFWVSGIYFRQLERKIGNAIFAFFKWLLEILTNVKKEEVGVQEIVETPIPQIDGEGYGEVIHGSEWMRRFFEALEQMLWVVVEVLWAAFLIFVLFSTVYGIWYVFYHKGKRTESRTLQQEDIIIQSIKKEPKRKKQGRGLFVFRNPNQKIRQMFYLEIKDYQKGKCNKECMTATELANQVCDERKEVAGALLPYYQCARYSKKGVTEEEVVKCTKYRKYAKRNVLSHRSDV